MINQNELRLGNYVLKRGYSLLSTSPWAIEKLDTFLFEEFLGEQSYLIEIEPIPLTAEMLKDFDFVIVDDHYFWANKEFSFYRINAADIRFYVSQIGNRFSYFNECADDYYSYHEPEIKYVHQLQNLVFALTGYELELKFSSSTAPTP